MMNTGQEPDSQWTDDVLQDDVTCWNSNRDKNSSQENENEPVRVHGLF